MSWQQVVNTAIIGLTGVSGGLIVALYSRRDESRAWLRDRRQGVYGQLVASAMSVGEFMHVTMPHAVTMEHRPDEQQLLAQLTSAFDDFKSAEGASLLFASADLVSAMSRLHHELTATMIAGQAWLVSYRQPGSDETETEALRLTLDGQAEGTQAATREVIRASRQELGVPDE